MWSVSFLFGVDERMVRTSCATGDDATSAEELVSNAVAALGIELIEHRMIENPALTSPALDTEYL